MRNSKSIKTSILKGEVEKCFPAQCCTKGKQLTLSLLCSLPFLLFYAKASTEVRLAFIPFQYGHNRDWTSHRLPTCQHTYLQAYQPAFLGASCSHVHNFTYELWTIQLKDTLKLYSGTLCKQMHRTLSGSYHMTQGSYLPFTSNMPELPNTCIGNKQLQKGRK